MPIDKLIIATNENDILDRFFKSGGRYTKWPVHGKDANDGIPEDGAKAHSDGVRETLSPAMATSSDSYGFSRSMLEGPTQRTKDVKRPANRSKLG